MDLTDLMKIAREASAPDTDTDCGTCLAQPGEKCTDSCDQRGALAVKQVRILVKEMTQEARDQIWKEAQEHQARDSDVPGFFWVWWALDDELAK